MMKSIVVGSTQMIKVLIYLWNLNPTINNKTTANCVYAIFTVTPFAIILIELILIAGFITFI